MIFKHLFHEQMRSLRAQLFKVRVDMGMMKRHNAFVYKNLTLFVTSKEMKWLYVRQTGKQTKKETDCYD